MELQGVAGIQQNSDGALTALRSGKTGETMISELQGRFYEQTYRGNLYSIGCVLTPLSAATILLTASAQPIVGVWNPTTSGVNLVILQAALRAAVNNVSATAPGDFVWASSTGNVGALTAGLSPFNRKTLATSGSQAKAFALSTASLLTGLTNNVVVFESAAELNTPTALNTTTIAAATPTPTAAAIQNFDGSLIVPPGGVLALLNTVSTTTVSVGAHLKWEEVPV